MKNSKLLITQYTKAIDKINATLGGDIVLYTNNVLSKSPYAGDAFLTLVSKTTPKPVSVFHRAWLLIKYFGKSTIFLFLWISKKMVFNLASNHVPINVNNLHIVDIFTLSQNIADSEKFDDRYLSDLVLTLEKHRVNFVYLTCFYKDGYNPFVWYKVYKILNHSNYKFITEFDLLTWKDMIGMCIFVIKYPFSLINLIGRHKVDNEIDRVLHYSLNLSLKDYTITAFIRYLIGKNLAQKYPNAKLLSYCEFQVIDRTLYKGIKDFSDDIKIYAYQQFVKYPAFMNMYISEQEVNDVIPDKIIVNGDFYIPGNTNYNYMSLSIRSKKIFDIKMNSNADTTLVLLPYFPKEAKCILELISNSFISDSNLIIKPHPTLNSKVYDNFIQPHWRIVGGDIYQFLKDAKIVITSSSGTAIEAVSVGISVIVAGSPSDAIPIDPLINLGRGAIWDKVNNSNKLSVVYKQLVQQRVDNPDKIKYFSHKYMNLFFTKPTEEKILDSFDFDKYP